MLDGVRRLLQRLIRWLGSDRRSNTPAERCRANGLAQDQARLRGDWERVARDFERARQKVVELDEERRKRRAR